MKASAEIQALETPSPVEAAAPVKGRAVTVCICTHERTHYLRSCLDSLRRQSVGPEGFTIVVVDSASSPEASAEIGRLVATMPNASMVRVDTLGISLARNAGARAATGDYVAYIDDDAQAAEDWVEQIMQVVADAPARPAVLGGRALPVWEAPLPAWWPDKLLGVLTITEWEGRGEYRTKEVPEGIGPYGANFIVEREALLAMGGFIEDLGRRGNMLLSDEDVHLAWALQDSGRSTRHDARIVVHHSIQAQRLTPKWLLNRLYWQGASTVATRRLLGHPQEVWRELPRRLAVAVLFAPAALIPARSSIALGLRWRLAYALGYIRMAVWQPADIVARS